MVVLERCLYQVFVGEKPVNISSISRVNKEGDCSVCKYDPKNNGRCSVYYPILVYVVEVQEEKSE